MPAAQADWLNGCRPVSSLAARYKYFLGGYRADIKCWYKNGIRRILCKHPRYFQVETCLLKRNRRRQQAEDAFKN